MQSSDLKEKFKLNRLRPLACLCVLIGFAALSSNVFRAQEQAATPEHAAADHGAAGHAAAGHEEAYMLWSDLQFWSLLAFIGFIFAIKKLGLWDHMLSSMATRERAEAEAVQIAETELTQAQLVLREARGRIEALEQSVREVLAEGGRDAEYTRQEFMKLAEREAHAAVERVRFEIDRVKNQTLNDLFESLADKVTSLAEARLRERLQSADQDRLIETTLKELSTV